VLVVAARAVVAVALAAALVGGLAGGVVVRAMGWGDHERTRAVVVPVPDTAASPVRQPAGHGGKRSAFDPERLYAKRAAGVVTVYSFFGAETPVEGHASQGSGFVVSRQGYVLTSAHVITNAPSSSVDAAEAVVVEFEDGDRARATIVGWDLFGDVGLLRIVGSSHPLQPLPLGDSSAVLAGEPVVAIGSPFGNTTSVTAGIVSGTRRSISSLTSDYEVTDAIQTDAPINRGNSGGPLFDADGRVIGINAQIRSDSGVSEGVGFAIPINLAKRVMRDLLARGRVRYAYMGVATQDLTPSVARRLGYSVLHGALVACVERGSPAARAGLHAGGPSEVVLGREVVENADVIVAVDGRPVRAGTDLVRIISQRLRPGNRAVLAVVRGDSRRRVDVTLAQRPTRPAASCNG
jgi:S1-C subfamily serine protease